MALPTPQRTHAGYTFIVVIFQGKITNKMKKVAEGGRGRKILPTIHASSKYGNAQGKKSKGLDRPKTNTWKRTIHPVAFV